MVWRRIGCPVRYSVHGPPEKMTAIKNNPTHRRRSRPPGTSGGGGAGARTGPMARCAGWRQSHRTATAQLGRWRRTAPRAAANGYIAEKMRGGGAPAIAYPCIRRLTRSPEPGDTRTHNNINQNKNPKAGSRTHHGAGGHPGGQGLHR
jgi:hypothetical protein